MIELCAQCGLDFEVPDTAGYESICPRCTVHLKSSDPSIDLLPNQPEFSPGLPRNINFKHDTTN